jgi:hypothetical protein
VDKVLDLGIGKLISVNSVTFYEKYSKVFPNYVALPGESKYMFKNIERK